MKDIKLYKDAIKRKLKSSELSLRTLAVSSGLSEDTLKSVIYGETRDIKLSTLISIADTFNCTIDELIGRNVYNNEIMNIANDIRLLPDTSLNSIKAVIKLEKTIIYNNSIRGKYMIPLYIPVNNMHDGMYYDGVYKEIFDISNFSHELREDVNYAVKIINDDFASAYYTNDVLLFTSKRKPKYNDVVLFVNKYGRVYLRRYTDVGLEPIIKFGKIITRNESNYYIPYGIVIKAVRIFDIEYYR